MNRCHQGLFSSTLMIVGFSFLYLMEIMLGGYLLVERLTVLVIAMMLVAHDKTYDGAWCMTHG